MLPPFRPSSGLIIHHLCHQHVDSPINVLVPSGKNLLPDGTEGPTCPCLELYIKMQKLLESKEPPAWRAQLVPAVEPLELYINSRKLLESKEPPA